MWVKFKKVFIFFILLFIVIGGVFIIVYFMLKSPFNDSSGDCDAVLFSQYGNFIGGLVGPLFSLASFFLLYMTLQAQEKTLSNQKEDSEREHFETTFFNLLKTQQEIANNIKTDFYYLEDVYHDKSITISGRDFFFYARKELYKINSSLQQKQWLGKYDIEEVYDVDGYIRERLSSSQWELEYELKSFLESERIKYCDLIYGISKEHLEQFKTKGNIARAKNVYYFFFVKYHYVVGHYFRNLYHILSFIDIYEQSNANKVNKSDKIMELQIKCNEYAQFVQSEMSSYELLLLYYDALCFPKMLNLVQKYNLLENLPRDILIDNNHYDEKIIKLENITNLFDKRVLEKSQQIN